MHGTSKFVKNKVIIRIRDRVCETPEELMESDLFAEVVKRYISHLQRRSAPLLEIFGRESSGIGPADVKKLIEVLQVLEKLPLSAVPKLVKDGERFIEDPPLLLDLVEGLYNYWRTFERFIICDSRFGSLDKRPYRTFDATVESLMHLLRQTYRDVEEHITGRHPSIYRQIHAGAELAVIALRKEFRFPEKSFSPLRDIAVIRQLLMYPPLLLNPPMNKRSGRFERISRNPMELAGINAEEWLCYPAKVGSLLILVYVHEKFYELGFSLCNLFELADDDFLDREPDAVYLYGVPGTALNGLASPPTVFYDDPGRHILVGACPNDDAYGYFGYLKKMILTLHNIRIMQQGKMPFHGAMVKITSTAGKIRTVLIIGESGTGKSETLEALRIIGEEKIRQMDIIADDMGSLDTDKDGNVIGCGTETGAFVRLDDLQPGYAFGQLDRSIIMSPGKTNSRILLPVTTYEEVMRGYSVDMVLYANNYERTDEDHPVIERFDTPENALRVFREGTAMSKGTTTSTGLYHSYFANIFGPVQYRKLHEGIAKRYFETLFGKNVYVGQLRTRLGIPGYERKGPEAAARALLEEM